MRAKSHPFLLVAIALALAIPGCDAKIKPFRLAEGECIEEILPPTGTNMHVIIAVSDRNYRIRLIRAFTDEVSGPLCMAVTD